MDFCEIHDEDDNGKELRLIYTQIADVHNNLYIGIKQSGAFQHSSFLHGARASAAGLITVKDGQLRSRSAPISTLPSISPTSFQCLQSSFQSSNPAQATTKPRRITCIF